MCEVKKKSFKNITNPPLQKASPNKEIKGPLIPVFERNTKIYSVNF